VAEANSDAFRTSQGGGEADVYNVDKERRRQERKRRQRQERAEAIVSLALTFFEVPHQICGMCCMDGAG
jgi:hypothetical protein